MKDCKGKKLVIGDEVVFVLNKNGSASLATGVVTKIYEEACSVDNHPHILSHRVMKLPVSGNTAK
jgi:hypothetical protein